MQKIVIEISFQNLLKTSFESFLFLVDTHFLHLSLSIIYSCVMRNQNCCIINDGIACKATQNCFPVIDYFFSISCIGYYRIIIDIAKTLRNIRFSKHMYMKSKKVWIDDPIKPCIYCYINISYDIDLLIWNKKISYSFSMVIWFFYL